MNYLDIILAVLLVLGLFRGLKNGFFVELASLVGLVLGIYGAIHFSYYAVDFLNGRVDWDDNAINLTAFAITFLIIVLAVSVLARALTQIANLVMLGLVNKVLGGAFGLLKTAFILSVLLMFIGALASKNLALDEDIKANSVLYPYIAPIGPVVLPNILKEVEEYRQK